jgi:hypothetical protein
VIGPVFVVAGRERARRQKKKRIGGHAGVPEVVGGDKAIAWIDVLHGFSLLNRNVLARLFLGGM